MKDITIYNKEDIYNEKIKPLVKEVMRLSSIHNIPSFITFAVANDGELTTYISDMHSAVTNDICLKDDNIVKMANVLNGFDVVVQDKTIEIEM